MARKRKHQPIVHVELDIDSVGFEGVSIGRLDGIVHFVKGALPGEHVRARVVRSKKSFVEAEATEILKKSEFRIDPPCPHFGSCGGCKWQHFEYAEQAAWKRQHVVDAFERIGKIDVGTIHETVKSPQVFGYRNKMEFSFGASRWLTQDEIDSGDEFDTRFALGLHVPGRFDKVRHIDDCLLQTSAANDLLKAVHALRDANPVTAHHQRSHEGFLRHLVLRSSTTTGSIMTVLVTTTPVSTEEEEFVASWMSLSQTLPEGSTIGHAVNDTKSPVAIGDISQMSGPGFLQETSHGVEYQISPFSFFQTNTNQLPILVELALNCAEIHSDDLVWDLYCGTGTLTLPAAKFAKKVVGLELVQSSIDDAHANAERNSIDNIDLYAIDLHGKKTIEFLQDMPTPDVVMIDPPRAGMHPQVVEHLLTLAPERISYVSCNPATLARDCALLSEMYTVEEVTPVDMFPQTYHVEAVAKLRRNTARE